MNIVIIPGLIGHPEEKAFADLDKELTHQGHNVIKIAWPHFPSDMKKYSFTETIIYTKSILTKLDNNDTALLGFSMGGVIACHLAKDFKPAKLGLIVSPYQVGSTEDLEGKYKDWEENGYRDMVSSLYGDLRIPFSFINDAQKYNALDIIEDIHIPILFITGEKDNKTLPEVTLRLFEKANQPKIWNEIPNMEHRYQYQSSEMLQKVNEIIINFVNN